MSATSAADGLERTLPDSARPLNVLYLTSSPHSGSTLISALLSGHPQIATVGEYQANFEAILRCSCGVLVTECPFWAEWARRSRERGFEFQLGRLGVHVGARRGGKIESLYYHPFPMKWMDTLRDLAFSGDRSRRAEDSKAVDRWVGLASVLCEMTGATWFLDTSKYYDPIRFLNSDPRVRLKVVALIRDGRGVTSSLIEKEKWPLEKSVRDWVWANTNLERVVGHYISPDDLIRIRLEDLCREPERMLSDLYQFIGLNPKAAADNPAQNGSLHIIGNKMRHSYTGTIRLDESWRQKLGADQLRYFEKHAGWLNRRYGYGA